MKLIRPLLFGSIISLLASTVWAEVTPTPPDEIDPDRHYLFYLHGAIVEGSDGRPHHPDLGTYDYKEIIEVLESKGFWVISEIRRRGTTEAGYASLVSFFVDQLKKAGVPSKNITIVGASKGGIMACYVSNKQQDPDINYVILAGFFNRLKDYEKMLVSGRVLSVHDSSDNNSINPKHFLRKSKAVTESRVRVLRTGLGHALIYQPQYEWVNAVVDWSGINKK